MTTNDDRPDIAPDEDQPTTRRFEPLPPDEEESSEADRGTTQVFEVEEAPPAKTPAEEPAAEEPGEALTMRVDQAREQPPSSPESSASFEFDQLEEDQATEDEEPPTADRTAVLDEAQLPPQEAPGPAATLRWDAETRKEIQPERAEPAEEPSDAEKTSVGSLEKEITDSEMGKGGDSGVILEDTSPEQLAHTRVQVREAGHPAVEAIDTRTGGPPPLRPGAEAPAEVEPLEVAEEEEPFSLQPDDPEAFEIATQAPAAPAEKPSRPVRKGVWLSVGLAVGLGVCAWSYFRPWTMPFEMSQPIKKTLESIPTLSNDSPPVRWVLHQGKFIGVSANKPWTYQSDIEETRRADLDAFDPEQRRFTLVSEPPLDPFTRLAWIDETPGGNEADSGVGERLVYRDYTFLDSTAISAGAASLTTHERRKDLPSSQNPFPPAAVDDPDVDIGQLLIVVDGAGLVTAWRIEEGNDPAPAWEIQLESSPLGQSLVWLDWRPDPVRTWLMIPTSNGIEFLGGAGLRAATLSWKTPTAQDRRAVIKPMRLGEKGWGWVASDGRQCLAFVIDPKAGPEQVWSRELLEDYGAPNAPPQILTFINGDEPEQDHLALASPHDPDDHDGRVVVITSSVRSDGAEPVVLNQKTAGLTAADVNGDAYWDLVGLTPDGQLWVAPGPDYALASDDPDRVIDAPAAVGTEVLWRWDEDSLIAEYFDKAKESSPHRVSLTLPGRSEEHRAALRADLDRRRGIF